MKHKLIYFGHHKCASTWIRYIIQGMCSVLGLTYASVSSGRRLCDYDRDLGKYLQRNKGVDFLAVANASWESGGDLGNIKGFHVIRDPRDIIVSSYFSHRNLKTVQHTRQKLLQALSEEDGLLWEIRDRWWQLDNMRKWPYGQPNVMELKFEDLVEDPHSHFKGISNFLGLGIEDKALEWIIETYRWEKLTGRERGQEDVCHNLRKGIVGDWKNHFTDEHKQAFLEIYGDLPVLLGYERS